METNFSDVNKTIFNSQNFDMHQNSQVELTNQNKFLSQEEVTLQNNLNIKESVLRNFGFDQSFLKM